MRLSRQQFLELVGRGAAVSVASASVGCAATGGETTAAARASEGTAAAPDRAKKEVQGNAIKGTTAAVRRFIATASLRDMPADVVTQGKRCLIDGFGVMLAGSTAEGSHILRRYAQKAGGAREATVLGREPIVVTAAHAALANAGCGHALDDHNLKPEQIEAVRLRAGNNILAPLRYAVAKNELEAKFSVPFLMSAIILERRAGLREFTDEYVMSARAQQMMQRVTGVRDQGIEQQGFDRIRSIVEVDLVDGRTLVQPSDERYRGGPDNPFTRDDLRAKFDDCAQLVLPPARLGPAFAAIESVDQLPNVRLLIQALSSRA